MSETTPDLTADTTSILDDFIHMVAKTDRYPGKDEFGDERTAECLEHARACVERARPLPPLDPGNFRINGDGWPVFGDPIVPGCKHVMTGGCPFACFNGTCIYEAKAEGTPT